MMNFVRIIDAIDGHTAANPIRIIMGGIPRVKGNTMLEKMKYFGEHYGDIRNMVIKEPRGHNSMFASVLVPPVTEDADLGALFMHNEGMSTMCGHGTIGTVKAAAEVGMLDLHEGLNEVRLDAPAGRIVAEAEVRDGRVESVAFVDVPSFVYREKVKIPIEGIGEIEGVIVYGGAFYIFVEEEKLGLTVLPENAPALVDRAMEMKNWVNAHMDVRHPTEPDIRDIYGILITSPDTRTETGCRSRQICVFADRGVDRSPCGTGTSARMALLVSRGELALGETFDAASIIDTKFKGTPLAAAKVGEYDARFRVTGLRRRAE